MRAAILAVGTELLGTDRLDTNSLELTEVLDRFGVELTGKAVVGDDIEAIAAAVADARERAELILITGGLGPTADDMTREAVGRATGLRLIEDESLTARIRAKFERLGRVMPESNRRQARVPEGARVLDNPLGTAPGLHIGDRGVDLFLFPGVPRELRGMIERELTPWLSTTSDAAPRVRRTLRVACLAESAVEDALAPIYDRFGSIAILASPGDIRVGIDAADEAEASEQEWAVREVLGDAVYGVGDDPLESVVGRQLVDREATVATAESCTGGWLGQRLTATPGSSTFYLGGVVAYADAIKERLLGVPRGLVATHGAVSRPVVEAMAGGALRAVDSSYALAVSGIAGPGGGSDDKPVGTVDLALAERDGATRYRRLQLPGDREMVRLLATQWALDLLRRRLLSDNESSNRAAESTGRGR